MSWLDASRARLRLLFARRAAESRMDDEFRFHIAMETARIASKEGLDRGEARRRALVAFGAMEHFKEELRDGRGFQLRAVGRAFAFAWRSLRRRPAFLFIAVSSLAVALGLATTVIAQIDSLMHPYTPIRDVEQVYSLRQFGYGRDRTFLTAQDVGAALRASGIFEAVVPVATDLDRQINLGADAVPANVAFAGRDLLDLLGVRAKLGRLFLANETRESGVAIVGDDCWRRHFGNQSSIGDAHVTFEGSTYRIVGVVDAAAQQAISTAVGAGMFVVHSNPPGYGQQRTEFVLLAHPAMAPAQSGSQFAARLKPGVTSTRANAVLTSLTARWTSQYGVGRPPFMARITSLKPNPLKLREFHAVMIGAAIFILIIASANVSALMLARSVVRRRSQAAQLALGARNADLLREAVAEVTLLSLAGAALGIVIAYAAMGIMTAVTPAELSWLGFARPNLNPRVFAELFAIVLGCVGLATLIPAWHLTRIAPAETLKESSATTTGRTGSRFKLLVVGELSLAMTLLLGASLMAKTAHKVSTFDFGYEPRHVGRISSGVTVVPTLSASSSGAPRPELLARDLDAVVDRLRSVQGVQRAAWFAHDAADRDIIVSEATIATDMLSHPVLYDVGPGFLGALGIAVVAGRDFAEGDRAGDGAVILDQRSAARLFPNGNAVGRMVKLGYAQSKESWLRVVGVARNAVHDLPEYPEMDPAPVVYVSRQVRKDVFVEFVYRADASTRDVAPTAIRRVRDALPHGALCLGSTWLAGYEALLAGRRFTAGIFTTLSLASLALAIAGLFSVLSYAVNQRLREFSLRVALGAQRRRILTLVLHDAFVMVLGATAIGAFVGGYAAFSVYQWLWGVYPFDAGSLVIAEGLLLGVAAAASAVPAVRATLVSPADVMRAL